MKGTFGRRLRRLRSYSFALYRRHAARVFLAPFGLEFGFDINPAVIDDFRKQLPGRPSFRTCVDACGGSKRLMAENASYNLILARLSIEKNLAAGMAEQMHVEFDPEIALDRVSHLNGKR